MSHQLLRSLLMVCAMHSFVAANSETSSNSSSSSTARSVISTPKQVPIKIPIDVQKALMLPPDPPPMGLDDEAEKKGTFASKSDREKSELLAKIYGAYKQLIEPEEAGGGFFNADGSPRLVWRPVVDMTTAVVEGDVVTLMIANKFGKRARYQYDKKTGDLIIAPAPRVQCPQAWV